MGEKRQMNPIYLFNPYHTVKSSGHYMPYGHTSYSSFLTINLVKNVVTFSSRLCLPTPQTWL